jgi:predicted ATP-dependent endonuclease of OLD family
MGKGRQSFIKTEFALQRGKNSTPIDLILIEEPENHLSHLNMKRLINQIEAAANTQVIIATHSNSVCSRLDLHNASLISASSNVPVSLSKLPDDTANYFIKAPNNKILEFVLSKKVLLVEGDSEYILIESMYSKCFGQPLDDSQIHVIAVGGTSFKRYLDLALLLKIKVAVIRDNDGNYQQNCVENYADYTSTKNIQIFSDSNSDNRTTFEECLYQENKELCDEIFSKGRRTLSPEEYMLANKADAALALLKAGNDKLNVPEYIVRALEWIRE